MKNIQHIWETHAVHVGTMGGPVKHGVDDIEEVIELAIEHKHPSITFVIHTPRLTKYRYPAELNTEIRFIRGDTAYFEYTKLISRLKIKYENRIEIRFGIELEWQGPGLGLQWSRSKLLQASGIDFVIGSVHFSRERIPYDDSSNQTEKLIESRGGFENFWEGYLDEVIEMIQSIGEKLHVVGHLDLPKLYSTLPDEFSDLENSDSILARKLTTLLEMIKDRSLTLDVNLAGIAKGCGIYPAMPILKKANALGIPITIGTDAHDKKHLGCLYDDAIEYVKKAGYKSYVSFNKCIPENRPLFRCGSEKKFELLNTTINTLNQRYSETRRREMPKLSFGGEFRSLGDYFPSESSLGSWNALRARRGKRSVTFSETPQSNEEVLKDCIYFRHTDSPGTLSLFFSILASEGINIETAFLSQRDDGTGEAYLTVTGHKESIKSSIEFAKGTAPHLFIELKIEALSIVSMKNIKGTCIQEVDGVELPIPLSNKMILSIHENTAGVLLTILAGLASQEINITDLRLGKRGDVGYAILGVSGENEKASSVISNLGSEFIEVSLITN